MPYKRSNFSYWLREPLVHFLLIGAVLFLIFHVFGNRQPAALEIVITPGIVQSLSESYSRIWQRPPTARELNGLIQEYVKEEIFYREALALGLEKDDAVVRRRLRQKMESFSEDVSLQEVPDEKELQKFLNTHPEKFRIPAAYSFQHVYFNPEKRGEKVVEDSRRVLSRLNKENNDTSPETLGDPFLLSYNFSDAAETEVAGQFGKEFAESLKVLELKKWQGPVKSSYGLHLVLITERTSERLPDLSEIRKAVEREWSSEKRKAVNDQYYKKLRERYTVTIEQPVKSASSAASVSK